MAYSATIDNPTLDSSHNSTLLLVYAIYRQALTLVIWVLYIADSGVGEQQPLLFSLTASLYLLINTALLYAASTGWQPRFFALLTIIASDIIAIQLIAQASGDIGSGISVLMIVSVAAGSLFLNDNKSYLLAAFATITLLFSVTTSVWQGLAERSEIAASGWLGLIFFLTSAFVSYLSARVESSDLIAAQEHAIAQNLQRLNSLIIDRMQTGILVVKGDGQLISSNEAATELLGFTRANVPDRLKKIDGRLQTFLDSINSNNAHSTFSHSSMENNSPVSLHLEAEGRSLKLTWIRLGESNHAEFLVFIEDLSKISQQAQQLKLSSLGKLTASIAHEIRNPLGAVSHAAQLLEDIDQTEGSKRLTEIIVNQSRRCSEVIESVLSVSRGGTSDIKQFDLSAWLPKFIADYSTGRDCSVELVAEKSLTVRFDQSQLGQILSNLLDNALRYSKQQTGDEKVIILASVDSQQRPRLDIIDFGPGVAEEDIERLFEPFFTRSKDGSGLGLYICRELCEANQASIRYIGDGDKETIDGYHHCFRLQFSHPARGTLFPDKLSNERQ